MDKILTDEQIAKEEHEMGECGTGCKWCHERVVETMNALYQPKGFYISRYFMGTTFKA